MELWNRHSYISCPDFFAELGLWSIASDKACVSSARRFSYHGNHGQKRKIRPLFHHLQKSENKTTELLAILRECGKLAAMDEGKYDSHDIPSYSKCTCIGDARRVFDEMPLRDVVATNSMISGLCWCQFTSDAIELFDNMSKRDVGSWNLLISGLGPNSKGRTALFFIVKMRVEGIEIDFVTMLSLLSICADLAALVNGKKVHGLLTKYRFELYLPVGNAIIDMYAKSGRMDDACLCFENMPFKNVISWTSLIMGYGKHGLGLEALHAFDRMETEGFVPNKITFLGTLYACSHAGLVHEGWRNYNTMIHRYSIEPMMEHYTSMVDLFARAGCFQDAHKFIETMPVQPDAKLLTAFLSSCCSHKNVELARTVGQKLLELEPEEAGAYMLLSNFYGLVRDLEGVAKVRKLMLDKGIRKEKACTWIDINRTAHNFESGDRTHSAAKHIYSYLEHLVEKMKRNGYVPNTSMVMPKCRRAHEGRESFCSQ